ncbi:MAG: hypothetical protein JWQ49_4663 [Edaphobacter sp.]|nr:hypothetical protein [Edaphobacter sp.]
MKLARNFFVTAKALQEEIRKELGPPEEGLRSSTQTVILDSIVRNTRGYIERVSNQINGAYQNGWYDACAVMIRRLLETLIIESFEYHGIAVKIKNPAGDFFYLKDLIDKCLQETSWNLTRNCKQAMRKLKDIGDKSAHSRRYNAHRGDIDPLLGDIRLVVQELVYLAALK